MAVDLPFALTLDTVGPLVGFDAIDLDNDLFVPVDAGLLTGPATQLGVPIPWQVLRLSNVATATLAGAPVFMGSATAKTKNGRTQQLTVELAGKAKVLNDCAAPLGFDVPAGALPAFAAALCAQHGVACVVKGGLPRTEPIKAGSTETVWALLQMLARENNCWVWTDALGVVHIEPLAPYYAAPPVAALIAMPAGPQAAANNLLDYTLRDDAGDRYSHIVVRGDGAQRAQHGNAASGLLSIPVIGTAADPELIARGIYRPLVIEAGEARTIAQAQARAMRELLIRRVQGLKVECDVAGWQTPLGVPWAVTQMVTLAIPAEGVAGPFMVAGRRFTLDKQNGRRTRLTLIEPGAL